MSRYLISTVKEVIEVSRRPVPVLDKNGAPTGAVEYQSATVLKACELMAKSYFYNLLSILIRRRIVSVGLDEEKVIVFHDGFRLGRWGDFFRKKGMQNVMLDTHIYIFAMENFMPVHAEWVQRLYMAFNSLMLRRAGRYVPVVTGEWCIANRRAQKLIGREGKEEECRRRFRQTARLEQNVWERTAGSIYWNYQLYRDREKPFDEVWKNGWDLSRCWAEGWID